MKQYILALDEGTTSARAILFDHAGQAVSVVQKEFRQIYPQPGWVEQDPQELYTAQYTVLTEAVVQSGIDPSQIAAIGITNQRETTVVWDRNTGKPVYNAIVWQCRRTAPFCRELEEKGLTEKIVQSTGLKPDAYFSGTKIHWILEHVEGAREKAEQGDLCFGTVDTWLLWKLTSGKVHETDYTNASRTMLFNIHSLTWDETLLKELNIPSSMLPQVKPSGSLFCTVELMGARIPVCAMAGDQQAALFGQCCFQKGEAKNTYGTGCFLLMHTGGTPFFSKNGLLTTMAATGEKEAPAYALEGSVFVGGAVIQWLRDELGLINESCDSEYFASKVPDSGGVYLVPAFTGLGAPYWNADARGTITGLTRGTNKNHIIRAALESIAYQSNDLIRAMCADIGGCMEVLKVDGGASRNGLLMQFQADIADVTVACGESGEATALGAAFLAGLTVGFWKDQQELRTVTKAGKRYESRMNPEKREQLLEGWEQAITCTGGRK